MGTSRTRGLAASQGPMRGLALVALVALCGCPSAALVLGPAQGEGTSGVQPTTMESSTGTLPDLPPIDACDPELGCQNKLDILFVIDNSRTMGEEQLNLAKNFSALIEQLQELDDGKGHKVGADVNIMVTTTDLGLNPKCYTPDVHEDYKAAAAGPISTPCTERLTRFTSVEPPIVSVETACTAVCDPLAPAAPSDQFLHFDRDGDNVMGGGPAEALSCIGPQGIDGCGYESPLEVMLQALNPDACWNDPAGCDEAEWDWIDKPFLREGATLAIAIITDGADCSVRDFNIMEDDDFMEVDPDDDVPEASAAICWHAGVECEGLDPVYGEYASCIATNKDRDNLPGADDADAVLHPLSRYVDLLAQLGQDREVIMLGVMGVPEVSAHADVPPYEPTEGGVAALVYRNWRDGQYPEGDILPAEWAAGVTAPDKQFQFGIGPGCTSYDDAADISRGQALPPARVRSVCESLNHADDPATTDLDETRVRCCIESICGVDFSPAIRCLTGLVQSVVQPEP